MVLVLIKHDLERKSLRLGGLIKRHLLRDDILERLLATVERLTSVIHAIADIDRVLRLLVLLVARIAEQVLRM